MYVTGVSAAAVAHLRENNNDKCSDSPFKEEIHLLWRKFKTNKNRCWVGQPANNCGQLAGVLFITIVTKKMTKIMTRKMARTRMK